MMTAPCALGVAVGASATLVGSGLVALGGGGGLVGTTMVTGAAVGVAVQPMTSPTLASAQHTSQRNVLCLIATSKDDNLRGAGKTSKF